MKIKLILLVKEQVIFVGKIHSLKYFLNAIYGKIFYFHVNHDKYITKLKMTNIKNYNLPT